MRRRPRLSYANVAATLALVLAMSGGAAAAGGFLINSTKQINPKVLKKLRGAKGTPGHTGPTGKEGAAGPKGTEGSKGSAGEQGPSNGYQKTDNEGSGHIESPFAATITSLNVPPGSYIVTVKMQADLFNPAPAAVDDGECRLNNTVMRNEGAEDAVEFSGREVSVPVTLLASATVGNPSTWEVQCYQLDDLGKFEILRTKIEAVRVATLE